MNSKHAARETRGLAEYLDELRSGAPTPGGGSASAYTGAMGAALLAMVCRLTLKSLAHADNAELISLADRLDALVDDLSGAARADEQCYGLYRIAVALPKSTDDEKAIRRAAMQDALLLAARAPLHSADLALRALEDASLVATLGTEHAMSDVHTALALLRASIAGSIINVDVNITMIKDETVKRDLRQAVERISAEVAESVVRVTGAQLARMDSVE